MHMYCTFIGLNKGEMEHDMFVGRCGRKRRVEGWEEEEKSRFNLVK